MATKKRKASPPAAQKTTTEALRIQGFKRPRERSPRSQDQEQEPGPSRRDPWGDGSGDGQSGQERRSRPESRPFPPLSFPAYQDHPAGSMTGDEDRGLTDTAENYRRFMRSLQEEFNARPGLSRMARNGTEPANDEMRRESTRLAETSSSTSSSSMSTVPAPTNSTPTSRGNPVGGEDEQIR